MEDIFYLSALENNVTLGSMRSTGCPAQWAYTRYGSQCERCQIGTGFVVRFPLHK